ncbi:MAG: radical SAM protein [Planctomycetes bacterium]|nr:radical SAM protein [Planctomycetota bacterium]
MPLPESRHYRPDERLVMSIELTNVCNYRCPFCPQAYQHLPNQPAGSPYNRKPGMMSRAVFERTLAEAHRVARTVELGFFGEQTLHRHYIEFIEKLGKPRPFGVELNTNISMLTKPMMQAWIDAQIDLVRLSVDAVTPQVYDHVRPGLIRDFEGRNVPPDRRMAVINEKIHHWLSLADHRPTRIVFVKSSHNEGERERFIDYWQPHLGERDVILMKQVLSYGGKITDPMIEAGRCNVWNVRYLVVDWSGRVSPCNLDTNMDLWLGSLMDDSVDALYHGEKAQSLRQRTGCGNDLTPCRTCKDANNWSKNEQFRSIALPIAM